MKTIDAGTVQIALRDRLRIKLPELKYLPYDVTITKENAEMIESLGLPYFEPNPVSKTTTESFIRRMCGWLAAISDEDLAAITLNWKVHSTHAPFEFNLMTETLDIFLYVRGLKKR